MKLRLALLALLLCAFEARADFPLVSVYARNPESIIARKEDVLQKPDVCFDIRSFVLISGKWEELLKQAQLDHSTSESMEDFDSEVSSLGVVFQMTDVDGTRTKANKVTIPSAADKDADAAEGAKCFATLKFDIGRKIVEVKNEKGTFHHPLSDEMVAFLTKYEKDVTALTHS